MKLVTLAAAVHKLVPPEGQLDREIAERVGQEILRDELEPGAWATALATSAGNHQEALACYARIRIRKLAVERRSRQAKSRSFEARRLNTCLGIKTVQDRLFRGPCLTPAELAPAFAKLTEKRDAIRELYGRLPLDNDYRKRAIEYYDEFFDTIGNQGRVRREFIDGCAGRATS